MEWYEQQSEDCPTQLLLLKKIRDLAAKKRRCTMVQRKGPVSYTAWIAFGFRLSERFPVPIDTDKRRSTVLVNYYAPTIIEAKREEFVDDALIYAKSLCVMSLKFLLNPQDETGGSIYFATENLEQKYAFLRPEELLGMDKLNLDQAPQDINKEEFQLECVPLQAFVAVTDPGCKKELIRSGSLGYLSTIEEMPHRRIRAHYEQLSELETGRIIGLKEVDWATWRIARHMGRSGAAIRRFCQEWVDKSKFQLHDGSGQPRATADLEDRLTVRSAVTAPYSSISTITCVTHT
ncbi:uncharacterized protein TNCV_3502241 [Trichonephila clavipes]|uniref:Uncharacterized protein n=1 Tax=Trichonephila clavipes TaxID=2585209 RepID=A0A8X6RV22_TRICX|nr:uncharacterized protein TNCV_3502241 [Trichonephila clavipes]